MPSGPSHDPLRLHLFVVLTDPSSRPGFVLIAPICSVVAATDDRTCIIGAGDHSSITHESFVDYSRCRCDVTAQDLERGVNKGVFVEREILQQAVFNRIVAGLSTSPRTKPYVKG